MLRRLFVMLVAVAALSACSSGDPVDLLLTQDDVGEEFTAEDVEEDAAYILRGCGIEQLGDGIEDATTASVTFNDTTTGDGFTHSVSSTGDRDPDEILAEVEDLVASCEPQEFGSSGVTTLFVRDLADGPELGDGSIWMATRLEVEGGEEAGVTEETPSVIFAKDGLLHFLSGPVDLPWEESVAFVVDLAGKL